jgi:hypothetical protein
MRSDLVDHWSTESRDADQGKIVPVGDLETWFTEPTDAIARRPADLALFLVAISGVLVVAEAVVFRDDASKRQDDIGGIADEDVGVDMDAASDQAGHDLPLVVGCGGAHDLAVEVRLGAQPALGIGVET